jgi:hypothetical protein
MPAHRKLSGLLNLLNILIEYTYNPSYKMKQRKETFQWSWLPSSEIIERNKHPGKRLSLLLLGSTYAGWQLSPICFKLQTFLFSKVLSKLTIVRTTVNLFEFYLNSELS